MVGEEVPPHGGWLTPTMSPRGRLCRRDDLVSDPAELNRLRVAPEGMTPKGMSGQATPCCGRSGSDTPQWRGSYGSNPPPHPFLEWTGKTR
jgi:hypothetical protein